MHVVRTGTHGLPRGLCAQSTTDTYVFDDLTPGFTTDSFQYSYTEMTQAQCNGRGIGQGTLSYAGNWDGQWNGDNIVMKYREQECGPGAMAHPNVVDASVYWLNVWVIGPPGSEPATLSGAGKKIPIATT